MHFSRMRLTVAVFILMLSLVAAQSKKDPSAVEQHIEHIQAALMPAVIVKGEPVQTTKLAERMAALKVPGVSIAVIRNGQIEWARGFGVAKTGGPAVTPETLFQAASISKSVTALGVMHFVQAGTLDLDTDVNQYLKTWKVPENQFTANKKVTLRELLSHTAGMTVHGFPGYASDAQVPTVVQVLNGEKPANTAAIRVDTVPGTIWRYSGGGYVVTQQLLEDVIGHPFPKIMHDTVLGPADMTRSTYEQPLPKTRLAEVALPYGEDGQPIAGGPHTYPEMAPAGLWTTPSDLARFAIEVQKALAGKSNKIISSATARQMVTPVMNHYGIGVGSGGSKDPYFTHNGANEGYRCNFIAYENGDGVVVMTNSDNGGQLAEDIIRTVAAEYNWPDFRPPERTLAKVDPQIFDRYAGEYQVDGLHVSVTREGDHLYQQISGRSKAEMFPESDHEFFLKENDVQFNFDAGAGEKAQRVTVWQNGNEHQGTRLSDAEAQRLADARATAATRFKEQKQDPRTEAVLRNLIDGIRRGEPNYEQMIPQLANLVRQGLPQIQATIKQHGTVQSLVFKGVGPGGADIYDVKFENGVMEWRIMLATDNKITFASFH